MNDYYYAATDWWPDTVRRYYRDWVPRYLLYNTTRLLERYALRRLAHVIAVSDAVAEIVGPAYGIPPTRFTTVRYGFDFSAFPPNDGTVKSPPMVLFVGGNFQRKGLLILLRAVPAVLARHPRTKLLIAGRSLYDWGARRLAHQLGVAGNCEFLGHVDHARIGAYFSSSTVFAMPSLIEAFGIPYLEAMSCGLPVVATSCPGPDEFLVDGQNALLVPPGDADSLAHALCRLLCDTALRARLRQGGKDTAKLFSPERMASETLAVYERVLHAYRGA
jgi:glycosyltransferase involved in cell wall biosynthesis